MSLRKRSFSSTEFPFRNPSSGPCGLPAEYRRADRRTLYLGLLLALALRQSRSYYGYPSRCGKYLHIGVVYPVLGKPAPEGLIYGFNGRRHIACWNFFRTDLT
jgi:hypothetical protein